MCQITSTRHSQRNLLTIFTCYNTVWNILVGTTSNSKKIFTLPKKTFSLMGVVTLSISGKSLFNTLQILILPCEYIFTLINFTVDNQKPFKKFRCTVSTQTIRISFLDQLLTSNVFRRVLNMLASKYPAV
jgi:hypothetical protein